MRYNARSFVVLLIAFWLVFQPIAALAQLQQPASGSESRVLFSQADATPIVDEAPETGAKPDIGPDSSIAAEEVPYPIVNGELATADVEVLYGWAVILSNSETSLTGTFAGECSGDPRLGWGTNFSHTYRVDTSIWVQAKATDSDVVGPCIKVSWVEQFSQREAPWLTLGGFDEDLTVDASTGVGIQYPDGAEVSKFPDAACVGDSNANWISDPGGIFLPGGGEPRVTYWMARWIDEPDTTSRCYRLEWSPDSGPNLLLNGDAMDTSTPIGSSVAFTYPEGAEVAIFSSEGCAGTIVQDWGEHTAYVADKPTHLWVKARWSNYPGLESTCFAMAWIPDSAPVLTLNGSASDVAVPFDESVAIAYPDGAEVGMFSEETCAESPDVEWQQVSSVGVNQPEEVWLKARWIEHPAMESSCLEIQFRPAGPPELLLNEKAADITVPSGETVVLYIPAEAEVATFDSADCSGTPINDWDQDQGTLTQTTGTLWVQARWIEFTDMTSPCYAVSWSEPTVPVTPDASPSPEVTETPGASPTPAPPTQPVETSTPVTETPVIKVTSVRFELSDGSSIEGAPWQLYAPSASQTTITPLLSGTVGANNSVEFTDLPAGKYQIAVQPAGMNSQTFLIEIGDDSEELVLQIDTPVSVTETAEPTTEPEVGVTGLPSTGSGGQSQTAVVLFSTLAALLAMFGSFWRKSARP